MKFLIVGLGSIGRRHLENLVALGESDIVLYRTHLSTLPDADGYDFPVETDLHTALAHQPDAVIVSNPTSLHLDVAIPAAEAGCHLFLEKPISHSMEGIDALREAVAKNRVRVFVGFQFRFHPTMQKARKLISEGAVGRPLSVRAHWGEHLPGWHPWEDYRKGYSAREDLGGGVILTLSHPLDYLRMLLGEVDSLWTFAGKIGDLEIGVEDTAEIGLSFRNQAIGSVHLNYHQQPTTHHWEITGTRGALRWDNEDGALHFFDAGAGEWQVFPPPSGFGRNQMFLDEMRHFIEVAWGSAEPICSLEDGVRALELALAAHRSAETGTLVTMEYEPV